MLFRSAAFLLVFQQQRVNSIFIMLCFAFGLQFLRCMFAKIVIESYCVLVSPLILLLLVYEYVQSAVFHMFCISVASNMDCQTTVQEGFVSE